MLIFGETKNIKIEDTRVVCHFGVRSFVPVFERLEETYVPAKKFGESGKLMDWPRYERWSYNYWQVCKSIRKPVWAIARIRRARLGQLRLM